MATLFEMTSEQRQAWEEWVASRPPVIQDLARRFPHTKLYRLTSTHQRVTIRGYNEDGTMIVAVTGKFNRVIFDRGVYGISPENLEECDLPGPEEENGSLFTDPEEIKEAVESLRPFVVRKE